MRRPVALLGLVFLSACGAPPEPCVDCRAVAGRYRLETRGDEGCETLSWPAFTSEALVEQDGEDPSQLALTLFDRTPGVLYEKDRFSFEAATVEDPDLGILTFTLSGTFFERDMALVASVSLNANIPREGCTLTTLGEMIRLP